MTKNIYKKSLLIIFILISLQGSFIYNYYKKKLNERYINFLNDEEDDLLKSRKFINSLPRWDEYFKEINTDDELKNKYKDKILFLRDKEIQTQEMVENWFELEKERYRNMIEEKDRLINYYDICRENKHKSIFLKNFIFPYLKEILLLSHNIENVEEINLFNLEFKTFIYSYTYDLSPLKKELLKTKTEENIYLLDFSKENICFNDPFVAS